MIIYMAVLMVTVALGMFGLIAAVAAPWGANIIVPLMLGAFLLLMWNMVLEIDP